MRLRDQLAALDVAEALSIWIMATNSPDGDVARGLCRRSCRLGRSTSSSAKHVEVESWDTRKGPEKRVQWHGTREAWQRPGRAKGGQDAWVARR